MHRYRSKIYKHYSSNRTLKLAPETIEGFKPREPYFKKLIRDHFPQNKKTKILEIGCGHGAFLYYVQQAGYIDTVGIDGSEEQVQEARRLGISHIKHVNIIEYLHGVDDDSLDLLIAFDVIEHFSKDELSDLLDEFHRVLKKGGKIICHQPNGEGPFGSFMRHWDYTHEIAFTRESIAQIFLSSGFTNINSYEDKPVVHGIKSFFRFLLWEYFIRNIYVCVNTIESGSCDKNAIFTKNFLSIVEK